MLTNYTHSWKDYSIKTPEERIAAGYWEPYVGIPDRREWEFDEDEDEDE